MNEEKLVEFSFSLEKEVPPVYLCCELQSLGYPQDGDGWFWLKDQDVWHLVLRIGKTFFFPPKFDSCSVDAFELFVKAPTCRELCVWLSVGWDAVPVSTSAGCNFPYSPKEVNPEFLAKDLIILAKSEQKYVSFDGEAFNE